MSSCLSPISIRDPTKDPVLKKKHLEKGIFYLQVPCGKCPACLENLCRDWFIRCYFEDKYSPELQSYFVTLSLSDDNLSYSSSLTPTLDKKLIQSFLNSVRYHLKFKYFLVGEYGPTSLRPHYHFILFNSKLDLLGTQRTIERCWNKGIVTVSPLNESRIYYTMKYFYFSDIHPLCDDCERPFRLMSRGLGSSYFEDPKKFFYHKHSLNTFINHGNNIFRLPRYFIGKLFSDEERDEISERSSSYLSKKNYFWRYKNFQNSYGKLDYILPSDTEKEDSYRRFRKSLKKRFNI